MSRFEAKNVSKADVPASREEIWALVSSPESLAELTPLVKRITADADRWCWQLTSISVFGVHIEPSFTEQMHFVEGRRITFEHRPPPGTSERAGATGVYTLEDSATGGTHLSVDITLHVELPLPALLRQTVERVMASMMARTGAKFARNLYARLGVNGASNAIATRVGG